MAVFYMEDAGLKKPHKTSPPLSLLTVNKLSVVLMATAKDLN